MNSPKDKIDVKNAIIEISNSKIRIEAENDNIKEIKKRLKDEFELDTKMVNFRKEIKRYEVFDSLC